MSDYKHMGAKLKSYLEGGSVSQANQGNTCYRVLVDTADRQEPAVAQVKAERLHDKIATLKTKLQEFKEIEVQLNETPDSSERRVSRWEHEAVLEAMQSRLDQAPEMMRIRRQTVEHPFGTLKSWMGATHFLTKTLDRVSTEMSLHVLVYNLKRVLNVLGSGALMAAMKA